MCSFRFGMLNAFDSMSMSRDVLLCLFVQILPVFAWRDFRPSIMLRRKRDCHNALALWKAQQVDAAAESYDL